MSRRSSVGMLCPTETPAYATRVKSNLMNIIRSLPGFVVYLLTTSFGHAALTPIGPLDFASGATKLDFAGLSTGTEANGLMHDAVLFQVTKKRSLRQWYCRH